MDNKYNIRPEGAFPIQAEGYLPSGEWYYCRARHFRLEVTISKRYNDFWAQEKESFFKFLDFEGGVNTYDNVLKIGGKGLFEIMKKIAAGNIPETNPLIPQDVDAKMKYNLITKEVHKYITDTKYKDWAYNGGNIGCWDTEEDLFVNICQNIIDEYIQNKN